MSREVLFVFVVLSHGRSRVVHFGVTEHPTQDWTMQQMREAFPWDEAPRSVLRDRDAIYGKYFATMNRDMGMQEVLTAPRSPWQNPFVERLVGSIRHECLDHVIRTYVLACKFRIPTRARLQESLVGFGSTC
jgi:putative transposase